MSKSAIYTVNPNTQTVVNGGTVALGGVVRRFGCHAMLNGETIRLNGEGYYLINISMTVSPSAVGTITATLLNNGVNVVGGVASETVAAADDSVNLSISSVVRVYCGATGSLSIETSGVDSNVSNVSVVVAKL